MRELTYVSTGTLAWKERPQPQLQAASDALVRPFVVARCDADTLPIHHRGVSTALRIGLKAGLIDPALAHLFGPVPFQGPFAIGHEAIGEVVAVGAEVTGLGIGDRVVVPCSASCGACESCARGLTSKCLTTRQDAAAENGTRGLSAFGFGPSCGPFGGMVSDLIRVPHATHMLVKLPTGLDPLRVASASDNLADAWRTVVPQLHARPGARVLIVGGGARSIGLYAAGFAAAHGAEVVDYLDRSATRVAIAETLAARGILWNPSTLRRGYPTPRSGGYDIVVEASSTRRGLRHAVRSTAPGGVCTAVGYYFATTSGVPVMHMFANDVTLHVGIAHPRSVLPELLTWMAGHDLATDKVTTILADFDDAPTAYAARTTKVVLHREPLHSEITT